ncbi:MAG TPA: SUMF1/EgtB/PvdO family nonheme iron enzyme, partial [Polyangia bacterium]|nr:SUMF1/EgtB/PvdO family nonheme iron enzyme [Polyangia bacterium]
MDHRHSKGILLALALTATFDVACGGGGGGGGAAGATGAAGSATGGDGGPGPAGADGGVTTAPQSCAAHGPGLDDCGPTHDSCCLSPLVMGGEFHRTYEVTGDGGADAANPASVSDFRLDKYDVTVGRFRAFVSSAISVDGGVGWRPAAGAGKHAHLAGGAGLLDVGAPADAGVVHEPGWAVTDDDLVAPSDANLTSCGATSTWTPTAGAHEDLPINCVNWWEAYAFCIWDGGFLPSEDEWQYAAAGGARALEYPWGSTDPGKTNHYAIYDCDYPDGSGVCTDVTNVAPVGSAPAGAGPWGQLDLVGNEWQWNMDFFASYVSPCTDCAAITGGHSRLLRGGSFLDAASNLKTTYRNGNDPTLRNDFEGFRCARSP